METRNAAATMLRQIGKDEKWLQEWLTEDPRRLGIGNITIKEKELKHYTGKGGRLDILAYDSALDTYYEVEVMLGECDSDHGFRVLDYWARERRRLSNSRHVAVLVAESAGDPVAYCMQRYRSYNPQSGTYLGTDGQRHPCP